jgi:hypothetical protein
MLDLTDGIYKDMTEKIIESYENGREIDSLDAFLMFLHAAGIVMNDRPEREETLNLFRTLAPFEGFKNYMKALALLRRIYCFRRIIAAYKESKISPVLRALLETAPPKWQALPGNQDKTWNQVIFDLIQSGKADFSSFKGQDKTQENWLLSLNVMQTPFPYIETDIKTLEADLPGMKAEALKLLEDSIKQEPGREEKINKLLDLADNLYRIQKETRSPFTRGSLMEALKEPALYLNAANGAITDLRPYVAEIKKLLSPVSWDYLKEFAAAGRKALKELEQKPEPITQKLFDDKTFIELRNSKVTNTLTTVSVGVTGMAEQLKIVGLEEEEKLDYKTNVPIKSGGEVIITVSDTPKGRVLTPGAEKLRTLFDALFTMSGNMNFFIPVNGYMELCKQKDVSPENRRKFRQKLKRELSTLKRTSFSARMGDNKESGEIGILRNWIPAPNDTIMVELEPRYCKALKQRNGGIMQISKAVFWLDEKNTHLLPMYKILCRNRTDFNNIKMGGRRPHAVSYLTLFEHDRSYPTIEKLRQTRQYKRDVIKPMLNAIEILNRDGYIKSKFIDIDDNEYTREEMEEFNFVDFMNPQKYLLYYELVGFKEDEALVEAAMLRKKEREEKRIKASKRKAKTK